MKLFVSSKKNLKNNEDATGMAAVINQSGLAIEDATPEINEETDQIGERKG